MTYPWTYRYYQRLPPLGSRWGWSVEYIEVKGLWWVTSHRGITLYSGSSRSTWNHKGSRDITYLWSHAKFGQMIQIPKEKFEMLWSLHSVTYE